MPPRDPIEVPNRFEPVNAVLPAELHGRMVQRAFGRGQTMSEAISEMLEAAFSVEGLEFDQHFVTFPRPGGWFIEHSLACRLAGTRGTCPYNDAVQEIFDDGSYGHGRWRITEIDDEGLPSLQAAPQ